MDFEFDTKAVEQRLEAMREKIAHVKSVDLGNELGDWQTEDMHRGKPFVMRSRARGRAQTIVRPHSLYEVERSAKYQHAGSLYARRLAKRLAKAKRRLRVVKHFEQKTSTRPYLRGELQDRLIERMTRMVQEKLKW